MLYVALVIFSTIVDHAPQPIASFVTSKQFSTIKECRAFLPEMIKETGAVLRQKRPNVEFSFAANCVTPEKAAATLEALQDKMEGKQPEQKAKPQGEEI